MKQVRKTSAKRAKEMQSNLFNKLRDSMFAMDARGEGFPCYIADRVIKYAPSTLKIHYPNFLVHLVIDLGQVLDYEFDKEECRDCLSESGLDIKEI